MEDLIRKTPELKSFLKLLSSGLPLNSLYSDLSGDNVVESNTDEEQKAIAELKSLGIDTALLENRFRM